MQKALHLSFNIPCPENILWWLVCIGVIGSIITGVMMLQASRFTLTRDGDAVSTQRFHRVGRSAKAEDILDSMSSSARISMRRIIRIDFWYTPFFYGLMICLSILALRNARPGAGWDGLLQILCWVPVASWLFDLLEDSATLSLLNRFEERRQLATGTTLLMTVASLLKWITGIAWLLMMLSLGVACFVAYRG